jgi:hypothetical protein
MKRILILIQTIAILLMAAPSAAPQTTDPIASIRQQYAAINSRTRRYRKVRKELLGWSLEGSQLVAYFDGPAIVKMVLNHYGEMGNTLEEYYYLNGQLIFLYEKVSHYNRPMTGKVIRTAVQRYYFDNDKMIRWLDETGKPKDPNSADFQTQQKEALESSAEFLTAARSKQFKIEK